MQKVYNCGEICLNWKALLTKTLAPGWGGKKRAAGFKLKDCITVLLIFNMIGSHRFLPIIIGKI